MLGGRCLHHHLLLVGVVITSSTATVARKVTFGFCPEYQTDSTSMLPTIAMVLQSAGDHYIVGRLPSSNADNLTTCAHIAFTASPQTFVYTYNNASGTQTISGSFTVVARDVTHSGYLQLSGLPDGVLGGDSKGNSRLHFLSVSQVVGGLVMVFISCINGFLMHFESAYVTISTETTILGNGLLASGMLYNLTQRLMWEEQKLYPVGETHMVDQSCYGTAT